MAIEKSFLTFLKDLSKNNESEWFHANKKRYESDVKLPFLELLEQVVIKAVKFEPELAATPVKSMMFRLNRDIRFSKDKRPYKEYISATIGEGSALAAHWAKAHLLDLEDRFDEGEVDRARLERQIVDISTRYKVLCRFTAYVAVDRGVNIDAPEGRHRIIQPVDLPAGWSASAFIGTAPSRCSKRRRARNT